MTADNTIQIAKQIKQLRKNPGLNQSEFCKNLGIKQFTLSKPLFHSTALFLKGRATLESVIFLHSYVLLFLYK